MTVYHTRPKLITEISTGKLMYILHYWTSENPEPYFAKAYFSPVAEQALLNAISNGSNELKQVSNRKLIARKMANVSIEIEL